MENGRQKRGMDRNGGLRTETGYGEKRRIAERNSNAGTVVKDGNVDGVDWKGRSVMECDGKAWNVMEGPEMVPE